MTTSSNDFAAWLATDAGRAAIRAGVDARLRDITQSLFYGGQYSVGLAFEKAITAPREPAQDKEAHMEIKALVDRFLAWPLPQTVAADARATNSKYPHPRNGTNLLSADEARQMIEHLLSAAPREPAQDETAAGVGISQDARRALADQIYAYFRDQRVHDLDSDDHDWLEAKIDAALTPPTATACPAPREPAAGVGPEPPHSGPEFGWVIERGDSPVFAPLYLAFHQNAGTVTNDDPPDGWLWDIDNFKAARFARREDAEKFWTCVIGRDRDEVRVAEHGWITPPAAPDALLPGLRAARDAADELRLQGMRLALVEISSGPGDEVERDKHAAAKLRAEIARRGGA